MVRKCVALAAIAALVLFMAAGEASAKAVKLSIACTPTGTAKVILNYCPDELQVVVNVNCSGLAPDTAYVVAVLDDQGVEVASEEFTTKPDKSQDAENGKGKAKKTKNFKAKGHANIHIPWNPVAPPPALDLWNVTVTAKTSAAPEE